MISQNFEQGQSHLNKLLEIIIKQHDAFRNQTGSFIDMIYFSDNKNDKMKKLQKKINEVYLISMNITKLLDQCKDEICSINGEKQNSYKTERKRKSKQSYKVNKEINKKIENMIKTTPTKPATAKKQIDFSKLIKSPQESEYQHQPSSSTNLQLKKAQHIKIEQLPPLDTNCLDFSMNMYDDMDVEEKNFQNQFKNEIFGMNCQKQKKEFDNNSFILNQSYQQNKPLDQSIFQPQDFIKIKQEESREFSNHDHSIFLEKYESFDKGLQNKSSSSKYQSKYTTSSMNKKKHRNSQKRGHYNICPITVKQEAIRLARIKSIKEASELMQIPEKNIKRWMKNGPERKKGAGRKTMDPIMEKQLLEWVAQKYRKTGQFPDNKEIKIQAKIYSNLDKFKASKGWCDKFLRRNYGYFEYLKNEQSLLEKN